MNTIQQNDFGNVANFPSIHPQCKDLENPALICENTPSIKQYEPRMEASEESGPGDFGHKGHRSAEQIFLIFLSLQ